MLELIGELLLDHDGQLGDRSALRYFAVDSRKVVPLLDSLDLDVECDGGKESELKALADPALVMTGLVRSAE